MKFRKKPVVIDAVQFTGSAESACAVFDAFDIPGAKFVPDMANLAGAGHTLTIPTLEGVMTATTGDWIIRGVKGEFYPCKPDIFAATYDLVGSGTDSSQRSTLVNGQERSAEDHTHDLPQSHEQETPLT